MADEAEISIDEIKNMVGGLSAKEKAGLDNWLATQRFIVAELGIDQETWFQYLQWAFANPCDFSTLKDAQEAGGGDSLVSSSRGEKAAAALGAKQETKLPGGGGLGNLIGMISAGKKEREEKK
jgi:hypothetical protein